MTRTARPAAARIAFGIGVAGAWLALAFLVRFRYIEAQGLVAHCVASPGDAVCLFREAMGKAMHFGVLGRTALALAVPALLLPGRAGRALAWLALVAGLTALVFYNASLGAPAAVLAVLRLARASAAPAIAAPGPAAG